MEKDIPMVDERGLPFLPNEAAYWKNPIYVLTGCCWFAVGLTVGMLLPLLIL